MNKGLFYYLDKDWLILSVGKGRRDYGSKVSRGTDYVGSLESRDFWKIDTRHSLKSTEFKLPLEFIVGDMEL